jgi:hypothetical protein
MRHRIIGRPELRLHPPLGGTTSSTRIKGTRPYLPVCGNRREE